MSGHGPSKPPKPLKPEWMFLIVVGSFAALIAAIYSWWTYRSLGEIEPVGALSLVLMAGLCFMAGGYLFKLGREIEVRPEDDPDGEQHEAAGEYGHFAPWSWWPLVCGISVSLLFLGPAIHQWWLLGIGCVVGLFGVSGHILEFNRGPHSH